MKSNCLVKLITALALLPLALLQSGCIGDDCGREPEESPQDAVVSLTFEVPNTADQENYLDIVRFPCSRDSVMVYQENGERALGFNFDQGGRISFTVNTFQMDHSLAFEQEVIKRFQLYINYREVHWIEFRYIMRDTGCSWDEFAYIDIYYDDVLYARDEGVTYIRVVVFREEMNFWSHCN